MSLPRGFSLDGMDSNARYWFLNAIFHASSDGERRGVDKTAQMYHEAFADGRLKKRKLPARGIVKVWIDPLYRGLRHERCYNPADGERES